ncbi:hypothetical protein Tco_1326201 [Tanacetum coccineum]
MHNNIMAAGSKDRPPMLGPGRYSQWRSRFLRYIDTKPNGGGLKKSTNAFVTCQTSVTLLPAVQKLTHGRPASQHTALENVLGDDIYSTVDACATPSKRMWIAPLKG